jgi:hypothetical protein
LAFDRAQRVFPLALVVTLASIGCHSPTAPDPPMSRQSAAAGTPTCAVSTMWRFDQEPVDEVEFH